MYHKFTLVNFLKILNIQFIFIQQDFEKKKHFKLLFSLIPKSARGKDSIINYPKINSPLSLKRNIEHEMPRPHVAHWTTMRKINSRKIFIIFLTSERSREMPSDPTSYFSARQKQAGAFIQRAVRVWKITVTGKINNHPPHRRSAYKRIFYRRPRDSSVIGKG